MKGSSKKRIKDNRYRDLLLFLLIYIMGSPFIVPYPKFAVLAHLSLTAVLFIAVYTVQKQKNQRSFAFTLLLPLLALYWLGAYQVIQFTRQGSYILSALYFGFLIFTYISHIAAEQKVTRGMLYATFSLYLVIGLFWGALYALLHELDPGAYSGALLDKTQGGCLHIFNYFSFVTLTTLGYGDITPQTPGAASLCQVEAIVGQFFTAVVIAWLVGMHVSESQKNKNSES